MNAMQELAFAARVMYEVIAGMQMSSMAVALYMVRYVAVMAILPFTGEQVVNQLSRMGIAMLLAVFTAFGRPYDELDGFSGAEIGMIAVKEALLGVALGFAMSTAFWVVEHVGALIDTAAGFNSVQLQNPLSGQQSTPVSDLLVKLASAVFFSLGGAIYFAQTMFESFRVWPLTDLAPSAQGAYLAFVKLQVGDLFGNTLKLAAPVLLVVLLIDVGVGLLSRSAEKLEPASLAQPVKGIVSVLMLAMFVGTVFSELRHYLVPRGTVQQLAAPAAR